MPPTPDPAQWRHGCDWRREICPAGVLTVRARLEALVERHRWLRLAARALRGQQLIVLDYPVVPRPRYGHGAPPHPELYALLDARRDRYRETLEQFATLTDSLRAIPRTGPESGPEPLWINRSLPGLDGVTIYGLLALHRPARFIEIGSGNSTRFAARAVRDHALPTRLTAIDPHPWLPGIEQVAGEIVRAPLETCDLGRFEALEAGDILFVDGSHRTLMNSDVTVAFLEIIPRLRPGVIVGVHDIFLPHDYPASWGEQYYSEQYLLAAYLLGRGASLDILLPAYFVSHEPALAAILAPLWQSPGMQGVERHGVGFWWRTA